MSFLNGHSGPLPATQRQWPSNALHAAIQSWNGRRLAGREAPQVKNEDPALKKSTANFDSRYAESRAL